MFGMEFNAHCLVQTENIMEDPNVNHAHNNVQVVFLNFSAYHALQISFYSLDHAGKLVQLELLQLDLNV